LPPLRVNFFLCVMVVLLLIFSLFSYTTLFRSVLEDEFIQDDLVEFIRTQLAMPVLAERIERYYQSQRDRDMMLVLILREVAYYRDRKSTRLNSSHVSISYAVFCLKKKKII